MDSPSKSPGNVISVDQIEILRAIVQLRRGAVPVAVLSRKLGREVTVWTMRALVKTGLIAEVEASTPPLVRFSLTPVGYSALKEATDAERAATAPPEEDLQPATAGKPEWTAVSAAAAMLGLHRGSVYRAIQRGELPSMIVEGQLLVQVPESYKNRSGRRWAPDSADATLYLLGPDGISMSHRAKLVYLTMFVHMDAGFICGAPVGVIARATGFPEGMVLAAQEELQRLCLIRQVRRPEGQLGYRLNPPWGAGETKAQEGAS